MKTTIELDDALLRRAKLRAAERGTTLRTLVEEALERLLAEQERGSAEYVLPDCSVGGAGLNPEYAEGGWERIRDEIYRGRRA